MSVRRFGSVWASVALFASLGMGCVEVNGGAIETRWVINDATGTRIECEVAAIGEVQLFLAAEGDPEGPADPSLCPEAQCRYPCEPRYGMTRFVIQPGAYAMWIQARRAISGALLNAADGAYAPPRIIREVVNGEVTDLGVNLIAVGHDP